MASGRSAPLRRAASFLALLAFEVGAVVLLTQLGRIPELRIPWHSLTPWLLNSPVEDVLAAILRMIALLMAWWLFASTLLYLVASLTRVPGAIRAVRWCTLPVIRTVTDHAVALTLATSLVGSGAGATIAAATPVVAAAPQRPGPVAAEQLRYMPTPAGAPSEAAGGADVGLAGVEVVGYAPRAAGPPLAQQQPEPGQPGYVPKPAGPPTEQPTTTTSSTSSTSTTSTSSTVAPSTTATPPSTTGPGYVPRPAGPPAARPGGGAAPKPPSTTSPHGGGAPTTSPPSIGPVPTPVPTLVPTPVPTPVPAPTPTPPPEQRHKAKVHQVVEGDNLWTISRDRLAEATGRRASELSDHEIAAYWLRVIAVNRGSLRSGDPDLIFPGERIQLPPINGS